MSEELREFDRSKWTIEGASPEITAEEQRRAEVCESYIRSAHWSEGTSANIRDWVAMNIRGAWPVAYTQGFKDGAATIERLEGEKAQLRMCEADLRRQLRALEGEKAEALRQAAIDQQQCDEMTRLAATLATEKLALEGEVERLRREQIKYLNLARIARKVHNQWLLAGLPAGLASAQFAMEALERALDVGESAHPVLEAKK